MKKAARIRVISICAFLIICASSCFAWGSKTHMKMVSDAYHIMPPAFRKLLGEIKKPKLKKPALKYIVYGSVKPDKEIRDFHNHVFHIHGENLGKGPFHVDKLVDEIAEDIKTRKPLKLVAEKLGIVAHYVADLVQPLHTGSSTEDTIEEKSYHSATEKDADKKLAFYGVQFDGFHSIKRVSARMIYESLWSNQFYEHLQDAYTKGERYKDSRKVIEDCYSKGVNNIADIWYTIWIRAGGKRHPSHLKGKYFPPRKKYSEQ